MNAGGDHPVIDFQPFIHGTAEERAAVTRAVDDALRSSTYFYLSGHGIAESKIHEAFARSKAFFRLSQADKSEIPLALYQRPGTEIIRSAVSIKEVFKINNPQGNPPSNNDWPTDNHLPGFRAFFDGFWHDCAHLLDQLLDCFSDALALDAENHLRNFHATSRYRLNLHHYPAITAAEQKGQDRMAAHSDSTSLSLLFQDEVGGLEVGDRTSVAGKCSGATFEQRGGRYKAMGSKDGTVVVFVGYLMSQWTNSRWKSTIHRVAMPMGEDKENAPERFSITFFGEPDSGTIIEPLPGTWSDDNPKMQRRIDVDSYLLEQNSVLGPS